MRGPLLVGRARRPGRVGTKAPPLGPPAPSPHLHVGHEALLDSPAVFIDLFQELQLIVVVTTHGGDNCSNSRLRFEEQMPRCPVCQSTTFRNSTRRRGRLRGRMRDGKRRGSKLVAATAFLSVKLDCPLVFTFRDIY